MNDNQIDDLKQFIDSRVSQSEGRTEKFIDERITQSEAKTDQRIDQLEDKMDTSFTHIAETIDELSHHVDERLTKFEQPTSS